MFIEKEGFEILHKEIKNCLGGRGVENVEFHLNYSNEIFKKPISQFLPEIISELTDNCADKGAKRIDVEITDTGAIVKDNIVEKNPEESLKLLQKIISTGEMITTKDEEREECGRGAGGGMGIACIVLGYLRKFDGKLDYYEDNGKIVAEVKWP